MTYRLIIRCFIFSFGNTLKTPLAGWKIDNINNVAQLIFCHFDEVVLVDILKALEAAIWTFQNVFLWLPLIDLFITLTPLMVRRSAYEI